MYVIISSEQENDEKITNDLKGVEDEISSSSSEDEDGEKDKENKKSKDQENKKSKVLQDEMDKDNANRVVENMKVMTEITNNSKGLLFKKKMND